MSQLINPLLSKLILPAAILFFSLILGFFILEPAVSRSAVESSEFTIKHSVGSEISFLVHPADVSMVGTIGGLTGGHATGSTHSVVKTNSTGGYHMDIKFSDGPAMQGDATVGNIPDYVEAGAEPDYNFIASTSAVFAYTVSASSTSDLDSSFLNDGSSACGVGSTFTADKCWKGPAVTDYRVINRTSAAPVGATTTFTFIIDVPNNPIPAVNEDSYTATATLTATTQ